MTVLHVLAISVLLAGPPSSGQTPFVEWWRSYNEQMMVGEIPYTGSHFRRKAELAFDSLPPYDKPLQPPSTVPGYGKVLMLYGQKNFTLLLVTPPDIMNGSMLLDERFAQTLKRCAGDRSWIVVLPENSWTEIGLNPYCSMNYGPDHIRIDLYWTASASWPLVDIVTNGLTCVPHALYGWDRRNRAYLPLAEKCIGAQTVGDSPDPAADQEQAEQQEKHGQEELSGSATP